MRSEALDRIPDYENYDFSGAWKGRGLEDRAERRLVESWARQGGGACLDIGGGFGRIAGVLEGHFSQTFLLDYSGRNLRAAASRLSQSTTLVRSDMAVLPFDDNTFDFVALVRVMHHVQRPSHLLSEVARVGRDGGVFVMSDPNATTTALSRKSRGSRGPMRGPQGHQIYAPRLAEYHHPSLVREEIRGVGLFDNRVGVGLNRLTPLVSLDVGTSRLWPAKANLFLRFRVTKKSHGERREPRVICRCGGKIERRECPACGRRYGRIVDLVEAPPPAS